MRTQARHRHAPPRQIGDAALQEQLEARSPDPLDPPYKDPDDPDADPEEDEDFSLPGEEEEYASPAVEPHEEPLVTP